MLEGAQADVFKKIKESSLPASQCLWLIWLLHLHFTSGLNGQILIQGVVPFVTDILNLDRQPELGGRAGLLMPSESHTKLFSASSRARACYLVERSQTLCGRRTPR